MKIGDEDSRSLQTFSHFTIEQAPIAIFWIDSEARIHRVNKAVCDMLGFSRDEMLTKTIHDFDPNFPREEWPAAWGRMKARRTIKLESQHITKDGRLIPVEVLGNLIEVGDSAYICAFAYDLTEHKLAEKRLRESEVRYRSLFHAASDAIFLMVEDRFVDCNPVTLDMFGCTHEEIIGLTPFDFSPETQPDGQNSREKGTRLINQVLKGNSRFFEWKHVRTDGTLFDAEVSLPRMDLQGQPYLLAIVRDITKRRVVEEALNQALSRVEELKDELQKDNIYLREEIKLGHNFDEIISRSDTLTRVLHQVEQVASTDATVLILGETGTGKELIARAIHNLSPPTGETPCQGELLRPATDSHRE